MCEGESLRKGLQARCPTPGASGILVLQLLMSEGRFGPMDAGALERLWEAANDVAWQLFLVFRAPHDRELRRFAAWCARDAYRDLDGPGRFAVEQLSRVRAQRAVALAEELASLDVVDDAFARSWQEARTAAAPEDVTPGARPWAASFLAAYSALQYRAWDAAYWASHFAVLAKAAPWDSERDALCARDTRARQAAMLRSILPLPFEDWEGGHLRIERVAEAMVEAFVPARTSRGWVLHDDERVVLDVPQFRERFYEPVDWDALRTELRAFWQEERPRDPRHLQRAQNELALRRHEPTVQSGWQIFVPLGAVPNDETDAGRP